MTPTQSRKGSLAMEGKPSSAKKTAKRRALSPEESALAIAFAMRLEIALKDAGFKDFADLARRLDIDPSTASQWKRGKVTMPRLLTFLRMCDLLGVRPHWLAFGHEPKTENALAAQSHLRLQVLADEGALGGRSLEVMVNLLQSRDFYTQCEIANPSACTWHLVNDERIAPVFRSGDRLLIDRERQTVEEGWFALLIRSRILIREVVRVSANKTTIRDGHGVTETLSTFEVGCYGAVVAVVRKMQTA